MGAGWTTFVMELTLSFWVSFHALSLLLVAEPLPHVALLELATGDLQTFRGRYTSLHAVFTRIAEHYSLTSPAGVQTVEVLFAVVELVAVGVLLFCRWRLCDTLHCTVACGVVTVLHLAFYTSMSALPLEFAAGHASLLSESLGIELLSGVLVMLSLRSSVTVEEVKMASAGGSHSTLDQGPDSVQSPLQGKVRSATSSARPRPRPARLSIGTSNPT